MVDLTTLTIAEAARRIAHKQLSPVELTQAALERITQLNPRLNAFITVLRDRSIAAAKAAEREIISGARRGPLHGIPIALKDLCATQGVLTTSGAKILRDYIPPQDATVALRLAAAGTVLLGKLHMNEFATAPTGATSISGGRGTPGIRTASREARAAVPGLPWRRRSVSAP